MGYMTKFHSGRSVFDDWFSDLFTPTTSFLSRPVASAAPATQVKELDDSYQISIAAPGLQKEDFNIELQDNVLCVSYDVKDERPRAFVHKAFSRSWQLPDGVESEGVGGKYDAGVLVIDINKPEEKKSGVITIDIA
jgi:HSP20 family protein